MAHSKNTPSVPVAGLVLSPRMNEGKPRYELHQFPSIKDALVFYTGKGWEISRNVLYHCLQNENEYTTHLQKKDKSFTLILKKCGEGEISSIFAKDLEAFETLSKESVSEKEEVVERETPSIVEPEEEGVEVTIHEGYRTNKKKNRNITNDLVVVPFLQIGLGKEVFTVSKNVLFKVLPKEYSLLEKEIEKNGFYWIYGGVVCKPSCVKDTIGFFKRKGIYSVLGYSNVIGELYRLRRSCHPVEIRDASS